MEDYVSDLNASQRAAVMHSGGPLLVVAGPGTGKTLTLTRRIAFLVKAGGADPKTIAAITFTHRAAEEMRTRLSALLEERVAREIFVGTFHALGFRIVGLEADRLGFNGAPVLYDEEERKALLAEVLGELKTPGRRISVDKAWSCLEDALHRGGFPPPGEGDPDLGEVHRRYTERKLEEGALDFDDLILLPLKLFREHPDRLDHYREGFRHLFVDEYQDVNAAQADLVKLLGEGAPNLMAIGDPDQAIYSFRGSDAGSFLHFQEAFPGAEVLHLEENYRSSVTILNASDQVIRCNTNRLGEASPARAVGEQGLLLEIRALGSDREEAAFVARRIERLAGGVGTYGLESGFDTEEDEEFGFSEMAVLYRLNAQAAGLCAALEKVGIPYQRVGTQRRGPDLHERLILAAARVMINPADRSARRILEKSAKGRKPFDLHGLLGSLPAVDQPAEGMLERLARSLAGFLPDRSEELLEAGRRLSEGSRRAGLGFFEFIAGSPLAIREDPFAPRSEKITLSTLHASKGLEFPVVFIVGMEEGIVPFLREDEEDRNAALEEERRLLYVGMTRARRRLYLTRSRKRMLFGKRLEGRPSPFLEDISEDLVRFVREKRKAKKKPRHMAGENEGQGRLF